ncbi:MAG: hypothetical protein EOM56_13560 [Deltaproteobacteria bacterium]|nr:hypothetical protein [Deltaproteobacteria bacterium]
MKKLTALEAIRKFCLQCQGGVSANVTECQYTACPFYAYRLGVALPAGKHRPLKTIRAYCVEECQAGNQGQVEGCQGDTAVAGSCPVFLFRMGKSPNVTTETREKRRAAYFRQTAAGKNVLGLISTRHSKPFQTAESSKSTWPEVV